MREITAGSQLQYTNPVMAEDGLTKIKPRETVKEQGFLRNCRTFCFPCFLHRRCTISLFFLWFSVRRRENDMFSYAFFNRFRWFIAFELRSPNCEYKLKFKPIRPTDVARTNRKSTVAYYIHIDIKLLFFKNMFGQFSSVFHFQFAIWGYSWQDLVESFRTTKQSLDKSLTASIFFCFELRSITINYIILC